MPRAAFTGRGAHRYRRGHAPVLAAAIDAARARPRPLTAARDALAGRPRGRADADAAPVATRRARSRPTRVGAGGAAAVGGRRAHPARRCDRLLRWRSRRRLQRVLRLLPPEHGRARASHALAGAAIAAHAVSGTIGASAMGRESLRLPDEPARPARDPMVAPDR